MYIECNDRLFISYLLDFTMELIRRCSFVDAFLFLFVLFDFTFISECFNLPLNRKISIKS